MRLRALAQLAIATLAVAGCGAGSKPAAEAPPPPPLERPVFPRCGVSAFATPTVARQARGWQVTYKYPPRAPRPPRPGQMTLVSLVEASSKAPRGKVKGGVERTLGGRRVSFLDKTAKTNYIAQWETARARYIAIADGATTRGLERVISCLP